MRALLLCTLFLVSCSTVTEQPNGKEVKDPLQVSLVKRLDQASLGVAAMRGTIRGLKCGMEAKTGDECLDQVKADKYLSFLDQADGVIALAKHGLRGSNCFAKGTCTDVEMQGAVSALSEAAALILKASGALKKSEGFPSSMEA